MADAPIVKYQADLATLLEMHPAPWRVEAAEAEGQLRDAKDVIIAGFDDVDDGAFWNGLAAAVNIASAVRPTADAPDITLVLGKGLEALTVEKLEELDALGSDGAGGGA